MKGDIHDLQVSKAKLEKTTKGIKKQANEIQSELQTKSNILEDLQQYSRRNCLIITGLPERTGENSDNVIKDLAEEIGVTINDSDIDRSHRLGPPTAGRMRPIIVKMTRYNKRLELIRSRRKLKGRNIGIQESLTEYKQYLLKKAQELVKRCDIAKSTWTWDGTLYVLVQKHDNARKKKVTINNFKDLNKIWTSGQVSPMGSRQFRRENKLDFSTTCSSSDESEREEEAV